MQLLQLIKFRFEMWILESVCSVLVETEMGPPVFSTSYIQ